MRHCLELCRSTAAAAHWVQALCAAVITNRLPQSPVRCRATWRLLAVVSILTLNLEGAATHAGIVKYAFTGYLGHPGLNDGVGGPPGMLPSAVAGGSTFSGTIQYVDSAIEEDIVLSGEDFSPQQGMYGLFSGGQSLRFNIVFADTLAFEIGPGGGTMVWVVNGNSSATLADIVAFQRSSVGLASTSHPNLYAQNITIDLRDTSETAITSDSLQALTPLNLSKFNQRSFTFAGDDDDGLGAPEFSMFGTLTSLEMISQTVPIPAGLTQQALLGGAAIIGGVNANLPVAQSGTFTAEFNTPTTNDLFAEWSNSNGFSQGNFLIYGGDTPSATQQAWDVSFTGSLSNSATLQFHYDESLLSAYFLAHENELGIWHFDHDLQGWEFLRDSIDTLNNTITVTTDGFSPFVLGSNAPATVTPEPASLFLFGLGGLGLCVARRRPRSERTRR